MGRMGKDQHCMSLYWTGVLARHPHCSTRPQLARHPATVALFEQKFKIAEAQLSHNRFLAGDSFCLADIQFGHILYLYCNIEITREALPNLAPFYRGLTQRRAYRDHVMLDMTICGYHQTSPCPFQADRNPRSKLELPSDTTVRT